MVWSDTVCSEAALEQDGVELVRFKATCARAVRQNTDRFEVFQNEMFVSEVLNQN